MDCFGPKYVMFELKSTEELVLMVLNIGAKFEGKLMWAFKNVIRNFANFYHSMFEKSKNWNFDGILLSKVENIKESYVSRQ